MKSPQLSRKLKLEIVLFIIRVIMAEVKSYSLVKLGRGERIEAGRWKCLGMTRLYLY